LLPFPPCMLINDGFFFLSRLVFMVDHPGTFFQSRLDPFPVPRSSPDDLPCFFCNTKNDIDSLLANRASGISFAFSVPFFLLFFSKYEISLFRCRYYDDLCLAPFHPYTDNRISLLLRPWTGMDSDLSFPLPPLAKRCDV